MNPMAEVFLCLLAIDAVVLTALYLYERHYGPTTIRDLFWSREEQAKQLRPRI